MKPEKSMSLRIAVPVPLRRYFDYLPLETGSCAELQPGCRVRVPLGRRNVIGIFMGFNDSSDISWERLKPVIEVLDNKPIIPQDILELCLWAADYYHSPIGEVLTNALPVLLRRGKAPVFPKKDAKHSLEAPSLHTSFLPNEAQKKAIAAIQEAKGTFRVFLLNGVTGSGKTEVYLQAISHILAEKKQVLVLVPEIGLTPQTIQRFRERFSVPIVALHSGLSEKERLNVFCFSQSGEACVVIGTRSAVFSPLVNLGLIIIDEEHDLSFKQQEGFRYHARDLAIMRAHFIKIPIVLGSATPALETLSNAKSGKFQSLLLPERAGKALLPYFQVQDIRNKTLWDGLSENLLNEIKEHLSRHTQVMLFLNRRGFAPVLLCHACGWMGNCKRCNIRMTYHQHSKRLHCHHCDTQKWIPTKCEACGGKELLPIGLGTERLEMVLQKHFPDVSIARIDRDNTRRKGSFEKLLECIQSGEHRILIGTQMLAKGHHFPNVTLVSIIDADGGFFSSDFRALERMGQLLLQVAGRAGRMETRGKVIIQTHHPDHPLLHQLFNHSYSAFAETILEERKKALLPPYTFFALFRAEAHAEERAMKFLQEVKNRTHPNGKKCQVLGPIPAPMPLRAGRHRAQLLVQATSRMHLQEFLRKLMPEVENISGKQRVRWSLDVDPMEMF